MISGWKSVVSMHHPSHVCYYFHVFVYQYRPLPTNMIYHTIVPMGGVLFEYFMDLCSGWAIHRRWTHQVKLCHDNDCIMTEETQNDFIKQCHVRFIGWLLVHIGCIGSNGRHQLYYLTFVLQFLGISRLGIKLLGDLGYGVHIDMFDEMRRESTEKASLKVR